MAALSVLALAGLIEAVYSRHEMQDDGISYLDMGDALLRGDWKMAINGHWSPLYPWLQGTALRLFNPSTYSQFSVVHFVNFLIYLFVLASFDFLLRATVANRTGSNEFDAGARRLPTWAVLAVGYSVFVWSNLAVLRIGTVSPDALMAGFLYLAVALLLRIWERPESSWRFVLLGAVLGLGYLAKAPVFPLGFVILAIAWILAGEWRKATPRVLAGLLAFLAVSAPWIGVLSRSMGRLTFGDSARFNYILYLDGAGPNGYFQNVGAASGHFKHPVRQIFSTPPVYEFSTPIKGTLPAWYDPSYWTDGAFPRFLLKKQLSVFHAWTEYYLHVLFTSHAALLLGFVGLCFTAGRGQFLKQGMAHWPVWLVGLAGLGMFAMVLVQLRYVAAFFTLCWVGLYAGLEAPVVRGGRRLVAVVTLVVALAMAGPEAVAVANHAKRALKGPPHNQWQVAQDLQRMGVKSGDLVARLPAHYGLAWARLLGVTVVAQIPFENSTDFWCAKPEVQAQVIEAFRRLNVTAFVAEQVPANGECAPGPDWQKVGDGSYHALRIEPNSKR